MKIRDKRWVLVIAPKSYTASQIAEKLGVNLVEPALITRGESQSNRYRAFFPNGFVNPVAIKNSGVAGFFEFIDRRTVLASDIDPVEGSLIPVYFLADISFN